MAVLQLFMHKWLSNHHLELQLAKSITEAYHDMLEEIYQAIHSMSTKE